MKRNHRVATTIDEAIKQILQEFPEDFLKSIKSLSYRELKRYQSTLDDHIRHSLVSWLHNNTTILDHCGSYNVEEITGFILWQLWEETQ